MRVERHLIRRRGQGLDDRGEFGRLFFADPANLDAEQVCDVRVAFQGEGVDELDVAVRLSSGYGGPIAVVEGERIALSGPLPRRNALLEKAMVEDAVALQGIGQALLDPHSRVLLGKLADAPAHVAREEVLDFGLRVAQPARTRRRNLDKVRKGLLDLPEVACQVRLVLFDFLFEVRL